jgi:cellulose synthase/poly-beta-1,6-N-acetylglucosamine synthase-like glycosyltransferase
LVRALETENVDFAYADMLIFDDHGRIKRKFSLPDYSFSKCFANWYLCGVAKLYRASLHAKHGYYDERLLAHDHELYLRFALHGVRFTHVPKALMGVREHAADREVHIHAPENWDRLIEESKDLVRIARQYEKG